MTINPEKAGITRNDIIHALDEQNIEARPVWKPMHLQPLFEGCKYYSHHNNESISDQLFENGLCLPSGSNMSEETQDKIIKLILDLLPTD